MKEEYSASILNIVFAIVRIIKSYKIVRPKLGRFTFLTNLHGQNINLEKFATFEWSNSQLLQILSCQNWLDLQF